jgi:SAM-dependent methyltransferase
MKNDFYNQLAPFYHLIFEDWEAAIASQADLLSGVIQAEWGDSVHSILDASCGIGTQSLGLAALGFEVTASDLSLGAVARAQKEAQARNLRISFSVCDMRQLYSHHGGGFDVVICAGNSVPHLLSDSEILLALKEIHACLRSGGGCVLTIRRYDEEVRGKGILKPFGVRHEGEVRYIIFQVWDFEGDHYDFSMYFIADDRQSGAAETHVMRSRYYAVSPDHLMALMKRAGFEEVQRLDKDASHPAILVGTRMT